MSNNYYIYFLSNSNKKVLYIGVTNDLMRRVHEHKNKIQKGFTQQYNLDSLVYFEEYGNVNDAIAREKQLKGWRREKKNNLINAHNPLWEDLYEELV